MGPRGQVGRAAEGMSYSEERQREIQSKRLATRARREAERRAQMSDAERAAEDAARWARRSATSRRVWAARRAAGWAGYSPEKQSRITAARLATTEKNRRARRAAMTPEERLAEVARNAERRRDASRRGWRTRRKAMGLPPSSRAESATGVRIFVRDLNALLVLCPSSPKVGLRLALEGLRLAEAAGCIVWDGGRFRLMSGGVERGLAATDAGRPTAGPGRA